MPCAANNAATLRLQRRFCRKNHMAPPPSRLPPAKPRTVSAPSPFRLSGSVSLVLAPCHSASHSAPPYPFPPHPAPPAHSLPRTFPHRLRSIPFRLSGSVSLVRLHATLHSAPPYPFPPHPAPPAHSLPRTFPPPLPVPSRSARLNPLLPVHSRSVIHPATPTEIIHRKSRKMRRFFCFFISSPYICPTNKIILFNTYPFITDRTN